MRERYGFTPSTWQGDSFSLFSMAPLKKGGSAQFLWSNINMFLTFLATDRWNIIVVFTSFSSAVDESQDHDVIVWPCDENFRKVHNMESPLSKYFVVYSSPQKDRTVKCF
jgi:hypothetical protein